MNKNSVFKFFLVLLCSISLKVSAQVIDSLPFFANGPVYAMQKVGNKLFIGGQFNEAGTFSNGGVTLLKNTQTELINPFPKCGGVKLSCPDGTGGVYIYSNLLSFAGDSSRYYFAHINNLNQVTAFNPNLSFDYAGVDIFHMEFYNGILYVSGDFLEINLQPHKTLFKLDGTTGALLPDNLIVMDNYNGLSDFKILNDKLYMVGLFDTVNSQPRNGFAIYDLIGDTLLPYTPVNLENQNFNLFFTFDITDSTVIIGGNFDYFEPPYSTIDTVGYDSVSFSYLIDTTIFQPITSNLAEFSLTTGLMKNSTRNSWFPYYINYCKGIGDSIFFAVDSSLYIYKRNSDTTISLVTTHNIHAGNNVYDIEKIGDKIYVGGSFKKINNLLVNSLFYFNSGSSVPVAIPFWNLHYTSPYILSYCTFVRSIFEVNGNISIGGSYTISDYKACSYFVGYDLITKKIFFTPNIVNNPLTSDAAFVKKIKLYRDKLYIIGSFAYYNGVFDAPGLAVIDANTLTRYGYPTFNLTGCSTDHRNVYDLLFRGDEMFIHGYFNGINGTPYVNLSRINLNTNIVNPNLTNGTPFGLCDEYSSIAFAQDSIWLFAGKNYGTIWGGGCQASMITFDTLVPYPSTDYYNEVCASSSTSINSAIYQTNQRGSIFYCLERDHLATETYRTYTFNTLTRSYSSDFFNAKFESNFQPAFPIFWGQYCVYGGATTMLDGLPSDENIVFLDSVSKTLINTGIHESNPVTGLYTNDTNLYFATYADVSAVTRQVEQRWPATIYCKIKIATYPGDPLITSNSENHSTLLKENFTIMPNPVSNGLINIYFQNKEKGYAIEIRNMDGKLIRIIENVHSYETLKIEDLKSGMYILKATYNNEVLFKKMIVTN